MNNEPRQIPEVPVIIIESDDEPMNAVTTPPVQPQRRLSWLQVAGFAVLVAALLAALFAGYKLYNYYHIGIPVSTTPSENIDKLKQPIVPATPEVKLTSVTVLDVPINFYELHGLKASIQFTRPEADDTSVYLYTRCADHTPEGKYIGSLVAEGKDLQSDRTRLGYMAMADGRMVIGIARSDKVKDYVLERGGSFFRQFILVSDGVIPSRFYLHGKVERRGIGRIGDTLYYIATAGKETLWDFADALREYGFTDAIYITGGNTHSFYRTADGVSHDIGVPDTTENTSTQIPWLVFKKR